MTFMVMPSHRERRHLRARTIQRLARRLMAIATVFPLWAAAQSTDPLPPQTQLVAVTGAPAATEETFTIGAVAAGSTQPDLVVTFTDFQTPAPLASASIVVTQGAAIVAQTAFVPVTAPTTPAPTATLALPAAVGQYTLRVIGAPNAELGYGTFSVCVAPKATPTACIADASLAGNITVQSAPANPTVTTFSATLTVSTAGAYTFAYQDNQFPVALQTLTFALFQGSQIIAAPISASPATLNLTPGTYQLFAVAQADATIQSGLFGVAVTGPGGIFLLGTAYPVGLLGQNSQVNNPTAQSLTLKVTDFQFPAALMSASALVTSGGAKLASASVISGSSNFMAPAGALQVWTTGVAGPANGAGTGVGTYEVDVTSAAANLSQSAYGVSGGGSLAYAFIPAQPLAAGSYQATANDFGFPAPLSAVQFAVAQNGALLAQENVTGTVKFTAAAGPVVMLVNATPQTNVNGLVDVNVQTSGSAPQLLFDQLQPVSPSGGFKSTSINLGTSGNFQVTLTDLAFPAQLQNLALIGSSAGVVLGTIYSGGSFPITAAPGNYQFTLVATPTPPQLYGLYGIQVVNAAPQVALMASPMSVTADAATTLSWTTSSATACIASGGNFTGSEPIGSGTASVVVTATTTYTLTCTGAGGSGSANVTVTATAAAAKSGGGGGIGLGLIAMLAGMFTLVRMRSIKGPAGSPHTDTSAIIPNRRASTSRCGTDAPKREFAHAGPLRAEPRVSSGFARRALFRVLDCARPPPRGWTLPRSESNDRRF